MIHVLLDQALEPSPGEARALLRRELLKPEYLDNDPIARLLEWLERILISGMDTASGLSALSTFAAMFVAVLLIGSLVWLVARARPSARGPRVKSTVLAEEVVTATRLRAQAEDALARQNYEEAVLAGFRALATRQVERGRLDGSPGTTAQEAARALAGEYPQQQSRVDSSAVLFDSVLYGHRDATRHQAASVLELDDELRTAR